MTQAKSQPLFIPMTQTESKWIIALEWAVLIAIILLAIFLRYWKIGEVPPGFNSDEAVGAIGALTTLREGIKYSYEGQGGGGALGFYFAAAFFYLFGPSINTIRGLAAWAGVVSIFVNYWAIREMFRNEGLTRARIIATLATFGLTMSLWHIMASRIAFAGIGVPFLMLPSVYFLWRGLNQVRKLQMTNEKTLPSYFSLLTFNFIASGFFLGSLMYIYLSGAFASPLYAAFFVSQWLIVWGLNKLKPRWAAPEPAYLTTQLRFIVITAVTAVIMLLPVIYVVLTRPANEPGIKRASQAFFLNPQINQGDPWGLLWRSFVGNFSGYGVSFAWLWGETPRMVAFIPHLIGFTIFIGFLIAFVQALRGRAAYLFSWLWFIMLLLPSILSPDAIPHNLRTIGATTPAYIFMALTIVALFDAASWLGQQLIQPRLSASQFRQLSWAVGIFMAVGLSWQYYQVNLPVLNYYFFVYPTTNDAQDAYHVYAVKMAEMINAEPRKEVAFILPRNTAAGDVFRNFTTDFLVDLAQPPAGHYWVVDDETTIAADLTKAAQQHKIIEVVRWKTSKHTGADPKGVMAYYLEKYGYRDHTQEYEYFDLDTYQLEVTAPNFSATETLQPTQITFGQSGQGSLTLTGYAFGDASYVTRVSQPEVNSDDLLWVRLGWHLDQPFQQDLKASLLIYTPEGQLVAQDDKLLQNNIFQVTTSKWQAGEQETTYFLFHVPEATPPGQYTLHLAVYPVDTLARLPLTSEGHPVGSPDRMLKLGDIRVNRPTRTVKLPHLKFALTVNRPVWPGLTLVGFETLPKNIVRSGETVQATLIWQKSDAITFTRNLQVSFQVKAGEGKQTWPLNQPTNLAHADYPTTVWPPQDTWRGWLTARIPPTLQPGKYELSLQVTDGETAQLLPIGEFTIEGWARQFTPPTPAIPLQVDFNGQTTLIGLDSDHAQIAPGETLNAKLYWRVDKEFAQNYSTFIHLIGPDGKLYGQVDHTPGAGTYPTTGWLTGEYIPDEYAIPLATDAPSGAYQLEIGLYNPATGERLPLTSTACAPHTCDQANQRVLVGGLTVITK